MTRLQLIAALLVLALLSFAVPIVPAASAQSLNDEQVLSLNTLFVQRVRQSMIAAAGAISSDGLSTGINIKRHAQVQQIMTSPDSWKGLFAAALATQSGVMNPATINGTVALSPVACGPQTAAVTFTNASAVISLANSFAAGNSVQFSGTLPTGFANGVTYYVVAAGLSASQFEVAATLGGTAIVAGGTGTNTALSQACFGNADAQQNLVSDTVINNTVSAVFNWFFGGQ